MQLITDILNGCIVTQTLVNVSFTTTTNGAAVDCQNSDVRTHCIIAAGVIVGSAVFNVQMQYSDDNTTWANETDANALSANISAAGITVLSYMSQGRYRRAVVTLVSGTSCPLSVIIVAEKKYEPAGAGYSRSPST